jgi:hypothetical protein
MIALASYRFARLPAGGIAPGATGVVTLYTDHATLGTATMTVRNQWDTASPSLKKCLVGPIVGIGQGIVSWDCS